MNKFGLIGKPVSHSKSPALFNAAYGGRYTYDLIESETFEEAMNKFIESYDIVNVTSPYKEQAFRQAANADDCCRIIEAANILYKKDGQICCANTDHYGVIGSIEGYSSLLDNEALVIGCGGAAKAAVYALGQIGMNITILNRNFEKAASFAEKMQNGPGFNIRAARMDEFCHQFKRCSLIINAIPAQLPGIADLSRPDIRGSLWRKKKKIILDANYHSPTFDRMTIEKLTKINDKIKFLPGESWLLHQAIASFTFFTGERPNIEEMKAVI